MTSVTDPRGTITNIYSKLDLVKVIDRMGFTNSFVYDNVRRLTAKTKGKGKGVKEKKRKREEKKKGSGKEKGVSHNY